MPKYKVVIEVQKFETTVEASDKEVAGNLATDQMLLKLESTPESDYIKVEEVA